MATRLAVSIGGMSLTALCAALVGLALVAGHVLFQTGSLAFVTERGGDAEIYLLDADTGVSVNLSRADDAWDSNPVWSPDGRQLAFESTRDGPGQIYLMNANGRDIRRLGAVSPPSGNELAAWSPDGTKIAFVSGQTIFRTGLESGDAQRMVTLNNQRLLNLGWSPDGTEIAAVVLEYSFNTNTYVMNDAGTNLRRITTQGLTADPLSSSNLRPDQSIGAPVWSPDSSQLVYVAADHLSDAESIYRIHAIHLRTNRDELLTEGLFPTWSPDGQHLAFMRYDGTRITLYAMSAGNLEIGLIAEIANLGQPGELSWSPNGNWLAFRAYAEHGLDIFIVNVTNGQVRRLTDHPAADYHPVWWP